MSYLTEDNIMVGNDTLEYPKGDVFSVFSKKFAEFGDKQAVVGDSFPTSFIFDSYEIYAVMLIC